uniref:hypothetical protein n=1 Tax=Ureibacillus chungkukjangi TaxID=1202712 RepID=UPI001C001865
TRTWQDAILIILSPTSTKEWEKNQRNCSKLISKMCPILLDAYNPAYHTGFYELSICIINLHLVNRFYLK